MIGILLVSHAPSAKASPLREPRPGQAALYVRQLGVTVHDDPAEILPTAQDLIRFLDQARASWS